MTAAIARARDEAHNEAWRAFLADVPMTWLSREQIDAMDETAEWAATHTEPHDVIRLKGEKQ